MSETRPEGYLPFKISPEPGDRLIKAPVWVVHVDLMERGIFIGVKMRSAAVLVDASNGRSSTANECVTAFFPESEPEARELRIKCPRRAAEAAAEFDVVPDEAKGWRRSFHSCRPFIREEDTKLLWRLYIIRGSQLIDTFTGRSGEAAEVIDLLLGDSQLESGSSEL